MIVKNCCTARRQLAEAETPAISAPPAPPEMSIWKWIAALTAAGVATHLAVGFVDRRSKK